MLVEFIFGPIEAVDYFQKMVDQHGSTRYPEEYMRGKIDTRSTFIFISIF